MVHFWRHFPTCLRPGISFDEISVSLNCDIKRKGRNTEDHPRYKDNVCYRIFCCKIEFAVIKKLDMDPSKA